MARHDDFLKTIVRFYAIHSCVLGGVFRSSSVEHPNRENRTDSQEAEAEAECFAIGHAVVHNKKKPQLPGREIGVIGDTDDRRTSSALPRRLR